MHNAQVSKPPAASAERTLTMIKHFVGGIYSIYRSTLKIAGGVVGVTLGVAMTASSAKADVSVYSSAAYQLTNGLHHYVPDESNGIGDRPIGSELGNTITFGGTARDLTTVYLGLFDGVEPADFTLCLYGGSDPNTASLLGSESASIGVGVDAAGRELNLNRLESVRLPR
jgi:hypothetical protein